MPYPVSAARGGHVPVGVVLPWFRAGGAPQPLAAYCPLGAASLAASYVNIANPGTYNAAPGVAPTWNASNGWIGNGSAFLNTGIVGSTDFTVVVRVSGVASGAYTAFGVWGTQFAVFPNLSGNVRYWTADIHQVAPGLSAGVLALNRVAGYRNGAFDVGIDDPDAAWTQPLWLLGTNSAGSLAWGLVGNLQLAAIYNTSVNYAIWVPAVMTAMAAL